MLSYRFDRLSPPVHGTTGRYPVLIATAPGNSESETSYFQPVAGAAHGKKWTPAARPDPRASFSVDANPASVAYVTQPPAVALGCINCWLRLPLTHVRTSYADTGADTDTTDVGTDAAGHRHGPLGIPGIGGLHHQGKSPGVVTPPVSESESLAASLSCASMCHVPGLF